MIRADFVSCKVRKSTDDYDLFVRIDRSRVRNRLELLGTEWTLRQRRLDLRIAVFPD